jgi:hypothetical protein
LCRFDVLSPDDAPTNFELAQLHVQAVIETRRNSVHLQCKNRPGTKFSTKKCTAVFEQALTAAAFAPVNRPQYFNFFVRRKRVKLLMTRDFEPSLRAIFQETLFGPEEIDLADEFDEGYHGIPNLKVLLLHTKS